MRIEFSKTIDKQRFPTILLETYYEILKELASSILLVNGFKTLGEYAHKEILQKLLELKYLTNEEYVLIDDLRIRRNNSSYDGIESNPNILNNEKRIIKLAEKLLQKLK